MKFIYILAVMGSFLSSSEKKFEDDFTIKCFEEQKQKKDHVTELLKLSSDKRFLHTDKIISMIKNYPLCLEDRDTYGNTVLHRIIPNIEERDLATWMEHRWLLRQLIKNGADIEAENINNETPVMIAVRKRKFKVFQFLIESGCNLNKQNHRKESVLHIAVYDDCLSVVSLLHTYGDTLLDESLRNFENFTALDVISKNVEYIEDRDKMMTLLKTPPSEYRKQLIT